MKRGHGGISVFKITLLKDTEYTIKLGVPYSANLAPQGGNPGGGGLAVLYRKANVIAVCGGGAGAGTGGRGGDGGGVGLKGEGTSGQSPSSNNCGGGYAGSGGSNGQGSCGSNTAVNDGTGGFKAWRVDLLKIIRLEIVKSQGYSFQIEMNFRAWRRGAKIYEEPIIFVDRTIGESKMSKKIMFEAIWIVLRLRILKLFGLD